MARSTNDGGKNGLWIIPCGGWARVTVPTFQALMLPCLRELPVEGAEMRVADLRERIASVEELTEEDIARERLRNGQSVFQNRVGWALTHLKAAGLVDHTGHGMYRLSTPGRDLLARSPQKVDMTRLKEYSSYTEWRTRASGGAADAPKTADVEDSGATPVERMERDADQLRTELEAEVLIAVREAPPRLLESVMVQLLKRMGYGGGGADRGRVTGGPGDGGIDGMVREDALGLDEIYVQAKRYGEGNAVGESDIRNFIGAIEPAGTNKGVFVTTSTFTSAARNFVSKIQKRIALIDGSELARLMVAYNVGVRTRDRYEVKEIDRGYFESDWD